MVRRQQRRVAPSAVAGCVGLVAVAGLVVPGGGAAAGARARSARARGTVHIARAAHVGKVLVTASGRTLYAFEPDAQKAATCSGACAGVWPPLLASGKLSAGTGARRSELGTVTDADGKQQVTYNGWPLYTFVEDTRAGVAHGQGIASYGGRWSTVTAAGKAFASSTSTSHGSPSSTVPSRPSGPSGGGYGYSGGY